jgi:hypothetical protein
MHGKSAGAVAVRTGPPDLEYRCHFIGARGIIEGVLLFSCSDDASAALAAMAQLHERAGTVGVELWKGTRLIVRYSEPHLPKDASTALWGVAS